MTGKIFKLPRFKSELGDALFPKNDYQSIKLNSLVDELVHYCEVHGYTINSFGLGKALGELTPLHLTLEGKQQSWVHEKDLASWNEIEKPAITAAIEKYFIDGGDDKIKTSIETLLTQLVEAGIQITGLETLKNELKGDWRAVFVSYAVIGRPEGVVFKGRPEHSQVISIMAKHGFTHDQIDRFLGALRF